MWFTSPPSVPAPVNPTRRDHRTDRPRRSSPRVWPEYALSTERPGDRRENTRTPQHPAPTPPKVGVDQAWRGESSSSRDRQRAGFTTAPGQKPMALDRPSDEPRCWHLVRRGFCPAGRRWLECAETAPGRVGVSQPEAPESRPRPSPVRLRGSPLMTVPAAGISATSVEPTTAATDRLSDCSGSSPRTLRPPARPLPARQRPAGVGAH